MWQKNEIFEINLLNKMTNGENTKIDEDSAFSPIGLSKGSELFLFFV